MRKNEPISNIMTRDLVTVSQNDKLSRVRQVLADQEIHHVPVVDGDSLVGIISSTDMMKLTFDAGAVDPRQMDAILDQQFSVETVMSRELTTLHAGDTVRDAAMALSDGSFHSLPVVDSEQKLAGIVTSTDVIRYLVEQY